MPIPPSHHRKVSSAWRSWGFTSARDQPARHPDFGSIAPYSLPAYPRKLTPACNACCRNVPLAGLADRLRVMAGDQSPIHFAQLGPLGRAIGGGIGTAAVEGAAAGRIDGRGQLAADRGPLGAGRGIGG